MKLSTVSVLAKQVLGQYGHMNDVKVVETPSPYMRKKHPVTVVVEQWRPTDDALRIGAEIQIRTGAKVTFNVA